MLRQVKNRLSFSAATFDHEADHNDRHYTRLLGHSALLTVPIVEGHSSSRPPSIITDGGDQAELEHRLAQPSSPDLSPSSESPLTDDDFVSRPWILQQNILAAYWRTTRDQMFLPKNDLFRLITQESVSRELERVLGHSHPPAQIEAWAAKVCTETDTHQDGKTKIKSYRKIFALLVIAESPETIPRFLGEDVSDLDLPLVPIKGHGISGFSRKDSKTPLGCFRRWSPMKLQNFHDHQWRMLAAYFSTKSGKVKHYKLPDQHILPFIVPKNKAQDNQEVRGGSGRVMMVDIHADHHNFPHVPTQANNKGFAIKQQMYDADRQAFEREANILKMFSDAQNHPHIVSLLATYEHLGKYHLIFHRAEGNLLSLWKKVEPGPSFCYANIQWMAEQCSGIAEGLFRLHKRLTLTVKQDPGARLQFVTDGKFSNEPFTLNLILLPWFIFICTSLV